MVKLLLHKETKVRQFRADPAYFCVFILFLKHFKPGKTNNLNRKNLSICIMEYFQEVIVFF